MNKNKMEQSISNLRTLVYITISTFAALILVALYIISLQTEVSIGTAISTNSLSFAIPILAVAALYVRMSKIGERLAVIETKQNIMIDDIKDIKSDTKDIKDYMLKNPKS